MFHQDIDERNSILAAIIESSEDAIISKTLNGVITSWNKAAERMFGYAETEMVGRHISTIIPLNRRSEEDVIIANIRQGKPVEHFQTIRVTKDSREIHISLTVSPVRNQQGIVVGASKIARDITRQKEAEERLTQYALQLEMINTAGKAIASESDVQKILQLVTDATTKLCGAAFGAFFYNQTDAKGESYMLYTLSGASREAFEKLGVPRNTAVFSKTFNGEGVFRSDDITEDPRYGKNRPHHGMPTGHLPVVSYLAVPVISPTGSVVGGLFFGHPEKARFRKDHEVLVEALSSMAAVTLDKARLYEEVQALNVKKDEFISFASHELKTPLTTIKGYLQLTEKSPDLTTGVLPKIYKQVNRLSAIIADLLDITKIQAGALTLNYVPVILQTLIKESVETVRTSYPDHIFEYEAPTREVIAMADGQKIGQVMINLLANAAKFSNPGLKIKLTAVHYGDAIRISVQDWGKGITQKELSQIFNRFYRVSGPGPKTEGLGLGLYISKEIMSAHHGRIWAESEAGTGSTFTIEFPIDQKNA